MQSPAGDIDSSAGVSGVFSYRSTITSDGSTVSINISNKVGNTERNESTMVDVGNKDFREWVKKRSGEFANMSDQMLKEIFESEKAMDPGIDEIRNALGIYESQEAIGSYRQRKKLEIAREQAELQQRLDAARAGVGYTDTYLFSKDLAKIEFQDPTGEIKLTHDLKNSFRDPNIKDRFFSDSNDQTVKSVLDRIIAEGGTYTDLAKHLKDLVVADIPVQLIELGFLVGMQNGKSFAAGGQYQPDYNNGREKERIVIPEGAGHLNNDSAHTIMHEIIHALSWRTLENKHNLKNFADKFV